MHDSCYSPPLPLNLSISERDQSFLKDLNGWSLALTGQDPHCWSLHFPPSSNWYRWLYISLTHSFLLYFYCQYKCWLVLFLLFGSIYILSRVGFFIQAIHNSCFTFFSITPFLHYSHFEVHNVLGRSPTNKPKWISLQVKLFNMFKRFAPVCWWLD